MQEAVYTSSELYKKISFPALQSLNAALSVHPVRAWQVEVEIYIKLIGLFSISVIRFLISLLLWFTNGSWRVFLDGMNKLLKAFHKLQ